MKKHLLVLTGILCLGFLGCQSEKKMAMARLEKEITVTCTNSENQHFVRTFVLDEKTGHYVCTQTQKVIPVSVDEILAINDEPVLADSLYQRKGYCYQYSKGSCATLNISEGYHRFYHELLVASISPSTMGHITNIQMSDIYVRRSPESKK